MTKLFFTEQCGEYQKTLTFDGLKYAVLHCFVKEIASSVSRLDFWLFEILPTEGTHPSALNPLAGCPALVDALDHMDSSMMYSLGSCSFNTSVYIDLLQTQRAFLSFPSGGFHLIISGMWGYWLLCVGQFKYTSWSTVSCNTWYMCSICVCANPIELDTEIASTLINVRVSCINSLSHLTRELRHSVVVDVRFTLLHWVWNVFPEQSKVDIS